MSARPRLRRLADRLGILARYRDAAGREQRTPDASRIALIEAMGLDASTEAAAAAALRELDARERAALIDPVQVMDDPGVLRLRWRGPASPDRRLELALQLRAEDGATQRIETRVRAGRGGALRVPVAALGPGIHALELTCTSAGSERRATQTLIVAPDGCTPVEARVGRRGAFGIWANVYALRGRSDHGVGNLSDVADLARLAGRRGAAFVGLSPLQATRNRGHEISPYSPVSRLFRNPLYLDPARVPELADSARARRALELGASRGELEALRAAPRIEHARVAALLERVVAELHSAFARAHRGRDTSRGRAYAAFRAAQGETLQRFATFVALEEELARRGHARDWRSWPARYRSPDAPAVRAFAEEHAERVDLHAFVQFELDRQLARAARAGRAAGLEIGLYQDLPLGSVASGFDAWAFPDLVSRDVHLGAPPDDYAAGGQDWGLPPLLPRGLEADGFRFWSRLLRASLAHAGALRLDHAMGLLRQFWIPAGAPAGQGAYVRFPFRELMAVLALESRRAGALVIGEDLGTVPPGFQAMLARGGVLSSRVLFFERRPGGGFRPARDYSARALVTATTHDMPTLAGFWRGRDLEIRHALGDLDAAGLARARAARAAERRALLRRLRADGALGPGTPDEAALCAAVHRFVCSTPAPLVGLSLDDLAGETEPVNVPGVPADRYPSWSRRMQLSVQGLAHSPRVREGLAAAGPRIRPR